MHEKIKQWAEADGLIAINRDDKITLIGTGKIGTDGLCGWVPVHVSLVEQEQSKDNAATEALLSYRYAHAKKILRENGEVV